MEQESLRPKPSARLREKDGHRHEGRTQHGILGAKMQAKKSRVAEWAVPGALLVPGGWGHEGTHLCAGDLASPAPEVHLSEWDIIEELGDAQGRTEGRWGCIQMETDRWVPCTKSSSVPH